MYSKNRVCPVERAGSLDNIFRRWIQNPRKLLRPYITEGMTVMDYGCGPGFFTIDMAHMVGSAGRVIAADLQEGMLQKLRQKIQNTKFEDRIVLHKCEADRIGILAKLDFVLAFYVVHEISDQDQFFIEVETILQPNGQILMVEPPIHVSKSSFMKTVAKAREAGLNAKEGPRVILSKSVILQKKGEEMK